MLHIYTIYGIYYLTSIDTARILLINVHGKLGVFHAGIESATSSVADDQLLPLDYLAVGLTTVAARKADEAHVKWLKAPS